MNSETEEFSDLALPWARWQIRKARRAAHHSGRSVEHELLAMHLLFPGWARAYFPVGLAYAFGVLYTVLRDLPEAERGPLSDDPTTNRGAVLWAAEAVKRARERAEVDGLPFPAALRCGTEITEGCRLFPGVDVAALVFDAGAKALPLPERQPPDESPAS